ncbi:tyrosine-type recombinase/integrase [Cyanobacteria bacterium FACHB-DQ100]|nr:tyrosine-type recombinase/integrase [Cyanobacteria bacterium FACHB-DQ100]
MQSRRAKGSVNVQDNNGSIRLRWTYLGKAYNLNLPGLRYSDKENLKLAQAKAKEIESDIIYERFDATLAKYDPRRKVVVSEQSQTHSTFPLPAIDTLNLIEIWEKYIQYKTPLVEKTTALTHYRRVSNHLEKLPYKKLSEALEIRQHWLENNSLKTAKFLLMEINAACSWAVKRRLIEHNLFSGMALEIEIDQDEEPDPFTAEERDVIIQAFAEHEIYKSYAPFVWFLFFSGCRTSEVVALKWKHIDHNFQFISISEAIVNVSSRKIHKGTKTGKSRKFPCNEQMQSFLINLRRKSLKNKDEDYLFPSLKGKAINTHTFSALCWKGCRQQGKWIDGIVTKLEKEGLVDHYRNLYSTRHSFISMAIEAGMPIHHVAKIVGNSPEVLVKHYLGCASSIDVPKL